MKRSFETARKSVEFAYPTSVSACRFGMKGSGCYVVELQWDDGPPVALSGHYLRENALTEARKMPQCWAGAFERIYPEDC